MKTTPFFSIIIPIYNVAPYLERCIKSILSQDFTDYEMILVDDGSSDKSGQICDDYARRYDHIRVIHKENGGLSSARNAGAEIATGEFIWWIDSDDWVEEQSLSILYHAAKNKQPDIVKFNHIRVTDTEEVVLSSAAPGNYMQRHETDTLLRQALKETSKFVLSAWSHIYKREFLVQEGLHFISERKIGSEDYLFSLQAMLVASSMVVLQDALYDYELRAGSLSQRYKENAPQKYTDLYLQLRDFYEHAGALSAYEQDMNWFYVWHLIRGICISNEYVVSENHPLSVARKNVALLLSMPDFQRAVRTMNMAELSWKQRVHLLAMRYRIEPLFYWMYVIKPKRKGAIHI